MAHRLLARVAVSVTELKRNPTVAMNSGGGDAVAVLNNNEPTHYVLPAPLYEDMLDAIDDETLRRIVAERRDLPSFVVDIDTF